MTHPIGTPSRLTRSRPSFIGSSVLQVMQRAPNRALTAEAIYQRLIKRRTPASMGSVYRQLSLLTQKRAVLAESVASASGYGEANVPPESSGQR